MRLLANETAENYASLMNSLTSSSQLQDVLGLVLDWQVCLCVWCSAFLRGLVVLPCAWCAAFLRGRGDVEWCRVFDRGRGVYSASVCELYVCVLCVWALCSTGATS